MRTVLKALHQNRHMYFDFTTPKGLKSNPSNGKNKEEKSKKRKIRKWEKKQTDIIPFNFLCRLVWRVSG